MCDIWLIHMRDSTGVEFDVSDTCLIHTCFICVTWLVRMCDTTHMCMIWLHGSVDWCNERSIRYMTHSYVWHDSFKCVTLLIYMCDMTQSCVSHDMCHGTHTSLMVSSDPLDTWLIYMCYITHSYVWHDSFICVKWLIHMCDNVSSDLSDLLKAISNRRAVSRWSGRAVNCKLI